METSVTQTHTDTHRHRFRLVSWRHEAVTSRTLQRPNCVPKSIRIPLNLTLRCSTELLQQSSCSKFTLTWRIPTVTYPSYQRNSCSGPRGSCESSPTKSRLDSIQFESVWMLIAKMLITKMLISWTKFIFRIVVKCCTLVPIRKDATDHVVAAATNETPPEMPFSR